MPFTLMEMIEGGRVTDWEVGEENQDIRIGHLDFEMHISFASGDVKKSAEF